MKWINPGEIGVTVAIRHENGTIVRGSASENAKGSHTEAMAGAILNAMQSWDGLIIEIAARLVCRQCCWSGFDEKNPVEVAFTEAAEKLVDYWEQKRRKTKG